MASISTLHPSIHPSIHPLDAQNSSLTIDLWEDEVLDDC